jgi:hypothetical protein
MGWNTRMMLLLIVHPVARSSLHESQFGRVFDPAEVQRLGDTIRTPQKIPRYSTPCNTSPFALSSDWLM